MCPGRWAGSGGAGRGKAPRRKAGQAPRWGRDRAGSGARVGRTQVPCAQRQKMVSASPRGPAFLPHTRWTSSWPASDMAGRRRPCGRAGAAAAAVAAASPAQGRGRAAASGRGRAGHSCGRRGLAGRLEEPRMPKGFFPLSSRPCCFRGRRKPGGWAGGCWRERRAGSLRCGSDGGVGSRVVGDAVARRRPHTVCVLWGRLAGRGGDPAVSLAGCEAGAFGAQLPAAPRSLPSPAAVGAAPYGLPWHGFKN